MAPPGAPGVTDALSTTPSRAAVSALSTAAIVIAGLYLGRELLVPLVLAVLLAFVLAPVVTLLQRARISRAPAVMAVVAIAFLIIAAIGLGVGRQAASLADSLPAYQATIDGVMRFVPFIGTAIGVVPPLLLAVLISPGWSVAASVLGLFFITDVIISQAVESLLYGHSTGLSPIAVIVSAAFWAFLWGPVGLVRATPLTVCLVVLGRRIGPLAFLEVMLSDKPPLEPQETFYQRALEGNDRELARQAQRTIAATSLASYYDQVALNGLALAQADLARDALGVERLDAIHGRIEALLAAIPNEPASAAPAWSQAGAILCIPGRGQLDDLAATMATQTLRNAGFGADTIFNAKLGNQANHDRAQADTFDAAAMACLSVLDGGSTIAGLRHLLRRMQRRCPQAAIVVCLWHATAESPVLQALRALGGDVHIILSLGELIALARALSARSAQTVAA